MPLHLTKIAFGCENLDVLERRVAASLGEHGHVITTRYKPKRATELIGGSLFWIVNHRIVVREEIIGFAEAEGGRCAIRLSGMLVPVAARRKRAHQGWRYLEEADAPQDLASGDGAGGALPVALAQELAALALI